jgi:hypothetical protein
MPDDLERKALRDDLVKDGFKVLKVVPNSQLPELLINILIGLAREQYQDIRIIPGDILLETSKLRLEESSHVIYVKEAPGQSKYAGFDIAVFVDRQTGNLEHRRVI